MLTRLTSWIRGTRQKKREPWEAGRGNLSKSDKQVADEYMPGAGPLTYHSQGFDETSRGRPKT